MNYVVRNFSAMNPSYFGEEHDKASGKPYHTIANAHLALSSKNWNTMEDKGKSTICVLYVLRLIKRHISE